MHKKLNLLQLYCYLNKYFFLIKLIDRDKEIFEIKLLILSLVKIYISIDLYNNIEQQKDKKLNLLQLYCYLSKYFFLIKLIVKRYLK